jgi:HK97 family phage portal protein
MAWRDWFRSGGEERTASQVTGSWVRLIKDWDLNDAGFACSPEQALTATPVFAAVNFISSAMASFSVEVQTRKGDGWEGAKGGLASLLDGNVNDEWSSHRWRKYSFWQTLTGGRQFTWIERPNGQILNLWPLNPTQMTLRRENGRTIYRYNDAGRQIEYPAGDIIDVPFALEADQLRHISPLDKGRNAIGLLLSMEKFANSFFAGGGVPPLSLEGPLPTGPEAMKRMLGDVNRAIETARNEKKPLFAMPPGYQLKAVGFDPDKGQMTEARRLQIEEIARLYSLPPWFLQDLTHANFANSENQDLHLVKHNLMQWGKAWEDECNLKLFGRRNSSRRVRLNMDSVMRGDFKTRADAVAALVQAAVYTPNDGRKYMGLDPSSDTNADKLYIQGATVPLGTEPQQDGGPDGTPSTDDQD